MSAINDARLELLLGRRSIRVYSPGEIDELTVTKLLETAMAAPSAMTKDPWRFVVVREKQMLSQLTAALPGGKMLATAALAIVVCGDLEAAFERQLSFLLQDCSAATQNLLLGAHALGLGACWVGIHPSEDSVRRVKQLLSLPVNSVPLAAVALGHPGEQPGPRTRYNRDYVHHERW
jgi:nitroreductase